MKLNNTPIKNSKVPAWLWSIWLIGLTTAFYLYRLFPDNIAGWVKVTGALAALVCTMIGKERYDKDDRLADWIDGKVKSLFRRS
ncbi:hypothetical protein FC093_16975 [Ilyomonas limi]|uniref:Holin n=1 Tax=Ilyomonas limi TaxID=2575867 RepID=A0A4U3KZY0_9BACT|nr:hypothetical protein [Ilyomonas limi]TKK66727.1 hypothetical protein FC093_16975 [Ilyomonas limi]